jgi:Pacifastin inhibitor (LCMII)
MRTLHTLAIGLSLTLLWGCHSGSNGNNDSGTTGLHRDSNGSRNDGPSYAPDAPAVTGSCTVNGQTHQVNEAFIDNCITWLCIGPDAVQQVSESLCQDAHTKDVPSVRKDAPTDGLGPDVRAPDAVARVDGQQPIDMNGAPDLLASEAGSRDVRMAMEAGPWLDLGVPDELLVKLDALPAEDTAPTGCTYGGVAFAVGDSFPSDCNTCFCRADDDVICTTKVCSLDGGS